MGRRRVLSATQAREVMGAANRGVRLPDIAKHFHVSYSVVRNIVYGHGYADVTSVKAVPPCCVDGPCPSCRARDLRDQNVDDVRAALVDVRCVECTRPQRVQAGRVLSGRGLVRCPKCNGRRK